MGGLQSKSRNSKNIQNTNLQTPIKRCSTLTSQDGVMSDDGKATARFYDKETLPQMPECESPKYDPTYILWKNAFEGSKTRTPRKVSPIRGDSSPLANNITDAVAWQLTPKGFPAYTKLTKEDLVNEKVKANEADRRNSLTKPSRRLSLSASFEKSMPRKSQMHNEDENMENCSETTLRHDDQENKEEESPSKRSKIYKKDELMDHETTLKNEYNANKEKAPPPGRSTPDLHHKFLAQLSAEKETECKKLMTELNPVHAENQKEFGTYNSSPKHTKQVECNYFLLQRRPPNFFTKGFSHKKGSFFFFETFN